ncbi:Inosine-5'-monophosphate dehydrogenase [archaeon HR06]|nr:Inosine-5'-monophosphate dehydrogenase [archaeon HR06]
MKIKDVMIKDPITAHPNESVVEVAKRMVEKGISSILIVDKGRLVGIATERDFMDRIVAKALNPRETKISDIMTKDPVCISSDASIFEALRILNINKFSQLPVVDNGKLVGIVALSDLTNLLAKFILASRV